MTGRLRVVAAAVGGALALAGCGFHGASSLPLPGGAAHGKTYHVTAVFSDVQDLTVQAAVRVNDVAVGDVTSIDLDTTPTSPYYLKARVGLTVNSGVDLPANAVATLEQTTLLGEKFVALSPPPGAQPQGRLANDAVISETSTSQLPSVEEVFGLLSQVLNGGDLADLQTINVAISKALAGREQAVRGALTQLTTFVGGLDQQKQQIVRALDELDRFSSALAKQNGTIATALTDLGPGLRVLADERAQFTRLLTHLARFGKVATRVVDASSSATIKDLSDLQPILGHLAAAGRQLPHALEILITYPFPRSSGEAAPGDFTNLQAQLDVTPILCAALSGLDLTTVEKIINSNPVIVQLLGGQGCPSARSALRHMPQRAGGHRTSPGTGSGSGAPAGGGSGGASTPTPAPSPTSSGLARLLNGTLGGGGR